jgi:ATP-dependent helicase IRC3
VGLRPYQTECLAATHKEFFELGNNRLIDVLPTGTGKTPIISTVPQWFPGKRSMILVHTEELADQAADKVKRWNPDLKVGIEMAERCADRYDDVVVASVPTIGRSDSTRIRKFDPVEFGSIETDECHHSLGISYRNVYGHFGFTANSTPKDILMLGVTATPRRGDGEALLQVYDKIAYVYELRKAIEEGYLCPLRGYKVRTGTSIENVSTSNGDFQKDELSTAINTPSRNQLVLSEWQRHGENRKTVGYTVDIAHAKALASVFKLAGVKAEAVWGDDPQRQEKIAAHKAGSLRVLFTCGLIGEGYDDWEIACILMCAPTKSQLKFIQWAGRGTRIQEDIDNLLQAIAAGLQLLKEDCIILDFTDNCGRHSLVTLPSIFGLPPKLDLKGRSVLEAVQKIEEFEAAGKLLPLSEMQDLEDIDTLQSYVEQIDLFQVTFSPEVERCSEYQWHKVGEGEYVLMLPQGQRVTISQNFLGHYDIRGKVKGTGFEDAEKDLSTAFNTADNLVKFFGRSLLKDIRRERSQWDWAPITPEQRDAIAFQMRVRKKPLPDLSKMSRHEAGKLLRKLMAA